MSIEALSDAERWSWSDGDLAAASTAGCDEAFAEIYRRFYARLVRLCQLRVDDLDLAEDIAQTTMLRLIRYLPDFDGTRPLWPWLRTIALRRCATTHAKRIRELPLEHEARLFEPANDPIDTFVEHLALRAALLNLPARQQQALHLRYIDDVGHEEAAGIIGITRNAFDQLLSRSRSGLAAAFGGQQAAQGVGIVAVIAILRRLTRRASDAGQAAAGPVMGASLAVAAGVAAMLTLQLGSTDLGQSPQFVDTQVSSVVVPTGAATRAAPLGRTASAPHAHRTKAATPPTVAMYVSPHALQSGGKVAGGRITVDTPLGTYTLGDESEQSAGGASACDVLTGATPAAHC